jgi:membrane-bound lytic murein transglycosylase D
VWHLAKEQCVFKNNRLFGQQVDRWFFLKFIFWSLSFIITQFANAAGNQEGIQTYQNNVHSNPEHKQKLADDITRYRTAENIWDILRKEFSLSHYDNKHAVQVKIEWYMNNQDYLLRAAGRAAPYLYYILQQVKKRHLPAELVLLPIVESGYNPFSLSNVGAAGIWQLMPSTATGLGVQQDLGFDGRRDIIASTRAALYYLAYLQSFFEGNWLLAIAAYNTGEGNVLAAIRRNIRNGKDTDFWSLPLAQQTRDYVPSLLALATIISHPDQYPVYFPRVRNAPYLAQVDVGKTINLKHAATLAGMSYQKLIQLNPGFTQPSSSSKKPYKLVLPIENVEQFSENLSRSLERRIDWIHYQVKAGDTLASISKKFKTTASAIRKMNHLSKMIIKRGTNLLIPYTGDKTLDEESDTDIIAKKDEDKLTKSQLPMLLAKRIKKYEVETASANNQGKYSLQPGDTIYIVRAHDTLQKIAKRFRTNIKILQTANRIKGKLKPGARIIVPTHPTTFAKAKQSAKKNLEPGDTVYVVRKGDSIQKIARKFKTTATALRLSNLLYGDSLREGESLIISTHLRG